MSFEALVEAIAARDSSQLSSMLEPNLREAFIDFFDTLDEEHASVASENSSDYTEPQF